MPIKDSTNIIVVGFNLFEMEEKCLGSVVRHTEVPYLLTFYNNFGNKHTLTEVWNYLIGKSPCKYICLLNNDTVVSPFWLSRMLETLQKEHVGIVCPSTNRCRSKQKSVNTYEKAYKATPKEMVSNTPLSGFCFVFRKELWTQLGGFNPTYKFYGQESDFMYKSNRLGKMVVWRRDSFVFHHGEASIKASGKNVERERNKARDLYKKMHSTVCLGHK
jgi:GT2 family glycosyltransferase